MARGGVLGLVVLAVALGCGGDGPDPEEALYEQARQAFESGGPGAAVEILAGEPDAVIAVRTVNRLVLHLFHEKKDLSACLTVGRLGLRMAEARSDGSRPVRVIMRDIAWHLGSFTWPGWGHEGIRIRKADREVGLKAAQHALEMTKELGLPPEQLASAYWLLGAHLILTDDGPDYLMAMDEALGLAKGEYHTFVCGIVAIGAIRAADDAGTREQSEKLYRRLLVELDQEGGEEAGKYRRQLETAHRVLVRKRAAAPTPEPLVVGPVTLGIVASRPACHFVVLSHLAAGLYPGDAFSLTDEERAQVDRFAEVLARKPTLGTYFFTWEEPEGALFTAAGAGELTPPEVAELSKTFRTFGRRIDALLANRRLDGERFAAALDRKKLEAIATKAAKFTKVESLTIPVWLIPAEPGKPRCRFEDGMIVVEVNPKSDPTVDLVYGVAHAFVDRRTDEFLPKYREAARQMGRDVSVDQMVAAIGSLLIDADPKAEERNFDEPIVVESFRLMLELEKRPLDFSVEDPFADFMSWAFRTVDVFAPDERKPK